MNDRLSTEGIRARVEDGIALLTIDLPGQSANTMSASFKAEFAVLVKRLEQAEELRGVILTSAKKTFFAGGDLRTLIAVRPDAGQAFFDGLESFKNSLRSLERLRFPVVAAINGAALGGGWEICLCAHARFCLDDEKLLLGLPEATLGLLPGAGGVNRMVRLLGLSRALPYLTEGRTFSPSQALSMGLLQGVAPDMASVIAQARQWINGHPLPKPPWDQDGFSIPQLDRDLADTALLGPLNVLASGNGCYPAHKAILAAAVEGACLDIDTALRVETRYLTHLATQQVSKNMIKTFFFDAGELRGGKTRPADLPHADPRRIALHAEVSKSANLAFAQASKRLNTVLWANDTACLEACRIDIGKLFSSAVSRGRMSSERAASVSALITVHPANQALAQTEADLVLLGLSQALQLPVESLRALPHAVVLGESDSAEQVPATLPALRLIGPANGPVAEVVYGPETDPAALAAASTYAQSLGRTPLHICDRAQGYVARLISAVVSEGTALRRQGVSAALLANACAQTDMARETISMATLPNLDSETQEEARSSPPELREIQDRMLFIVALEAVRCIETGVLKSVAEANFGSIAGAGFPRWTGGAIQYINQYGLKRFVAHAHRLASEVGPRFSPGSLLNRLAERDAQRIEEDSE
ncbi:MAG: enoyl-CoA hydratase-related protein [Ottowia sp.]|uniref:enoyl-CoA hydratase-related protein n=1 Tax=Ottowia sp. TaxID=1898956 RepID=UPI003C7198A0